MDYYEASMLYARTRNKKADTVAKAVFIFLFAAVFIDCILEAWVLLAIHILMFEVNLESTRKRIQSFNALEAEYAKLRQQQGKVNE